MSISVHTYTNRDNNLKKFQKKKLDSAHHLLCFRGFRHKTKSTWWWWWWWLSWYYYYAIGQPGCGILKIGSKVSVSRTKSETPPNQSIYGFEQLQTGTDSFVRMSVNQGDSELAPTGAPSTLDVQWMSVITQLWMNLNRGLIFGFTLVR